MSSSTVTRTSYRHLLSCPTRGACLSQLSSSDRSPVLTEQSVCSSALRANGFHSVPQKHCAGVRARRGREEVDSTHIPMIYLVLGRWKVTCPLAMTNS